MILSKTTMSAAFAAVVLGALTITPASAASKWSDISAVTNRNVPTVHTTVGGKESFSPTDLSAVTHKNLPNDPKQISHVSSANYSGSDLTAVTHPN